MTPRPDGIATPREEPPALAGCGDHGCVIAKPQGMGTNGGCRCDERTLRRALRAERARADAAEAKLAAISSLSEEVWENGSAATWVHEIYSGRLEGLPTQEAYEEDFAARLTSAEAKRGRP